MDSATSTPRSRDHADGDLSAPAAARDDATPPSSAAARVKLLVSFGGRIQLRSHDNQLSYVGGDTKILALDRATARFPALLARLATLVGAPSSAGVCLKYQLPGEDLDALVSVTNDEDLEQMIIEHDRLQKHRSAAQKPTARLRLFLFTVVLPPPPPAAPTTKQDPRWFVDARNSAHLQPPSMAPPLDKSKTKVGGIPDFLFGLEEGIVPPPAPQPGIFQQIGSDVEKLPSKANYPLRPEYYLWPPSTAPAYWPPENHGSALATDAAGGDQAMFVAPAAAAGQGYYAAVTGQVYRDVARR